MVNEKSGAAEGGRRSLKALLLEQLREKPGAFFTGEELAAPAGVTRVAVWKAVKSLTAAGYPITGNDKGYCLETPDNDFLYPWEFGEMEPQFHHWAATDSTMNRAGEFAAHDGPGGTVFTAEEQTRGRGRNGHVWASQKGGLFFTLLERPALGAGDYFRPALAAQIALGKALAPVCGGNVLLRWPNDICGGDKKLAGVLTEFYAQGDRLVWMSIGIGINVNSRPENQEAAYCAQMRGRPLSRRDLLLSFLNEWENLKKTPPGELEKLWNAAAWGRGREVQAREDKGGSGERTLEQGVFLGMDARGRGILKTAKGKKRFFPPGTVSFVFGSPSGEMETQFSKDH